MIKLNHNIAKAKAIEQKNKEKLIEINPNLNDRSGIYFLTRTDENNISYFYVGQARKILTRLSQHLSGYQHIDLSIKKRGFYSSDNPLGWKVNAIEYPVNELDMREQYWILEYTKRGYQCRYNKTAGGQGSGKEKINEYRPQKGYRDGIMHGKKALARELSEIISKHLSVSIKDEKKGNKISIKALEKFNDLLDEKNY